MEQGGSTSKLADLLDLLASRWQIAPTVPGWVMLLVAVVIAAGCAYWPAWIRLRHGVTIIHEMGHVVMAWLWGRRVSGISLHTDTSGLTVSAGKPTGLGMLFTMLAGYTAPPLTGLALTWATVSGWSGAALTLLVLLFVVAFWLTRNLFGLVTVTIGLATTVGMFGWGSPLAISTYVLAVGLFLVAAGFRGSFDLAAIHQRGEGGESDASQAARLTRLPAMVWVWFFGVVSGLCVVQTLILLTVGLDLR